MTERILEMNMERMNAQRWHSREGTAGAVCGGMDGPCLSTVIYMKAEIADATEVNNQYFYNDDRLIFVLEEDKSNVPKGHLKEGNRGCRRVGMNTDFGLDMLDYGARWYDSSIGRWHSPDLLAEKFNSITPYNYVMNTPINLMDPNGMDTLSMNRGELNKELSTETANVWEVSMSLISNGVETTLTDENGEPIVMYMIGNKFNDAVGDNAALKKDSYKLSFDQMSRYDGEDGWENTIRVTEFGVFIHPVGDESDLGGCKALYENFNPDAYDTVPNGESTETLSLIRDLYDKHKDNLTGDEFILRNRVDVWPERRALIPQAKGVH